MRGIGGSMRFVHTADWQVGMKCPRLGDASTRVREERLAAGHRVIRAAREHGADFILVAGDLFEDNAVDRVLVQKVADILNSFGGPVFVLPGNHDPLVPGSVWAHPAWKSASKVHLLVEEALVEVPGGMLYPCPIKEKHSGRNPTAWIPSKGPQDANVIRIGLAHGTVEGIVQDEPDYPIPVDAALRAGLNYLALGHWHSFAAYSGPDGASRMAYSGTHEPTRFGERESGNVLIIEIPDAGSPPSIKPVHTGCLSWSTIERESRESGDVARVRTEIEAITGVSDTLIEVTLSGILAADDRVELDRIEQILESRFLWGRMDASALQPSPTDDTWISNLPPGIIREAAIRIRNSTYITPEVAARALIELYAVAGEAQA
jgi:DNA repair exonuclease SbcCD nuclease subunit